MRTISHAVPGLSVVFLALSLAATIHARQLPTDLVPIAASDIPPSVCDYRSIQNLAWPPLPFNWLSDSNLVLYVSPSLGINTIFVGDQNIDYAQLAAQAQVLRLAARAANDEPPAPPGGDDGGGGGGVFPPSYGGYTYDTNGLYLEITNVAAGLAYLNLHHATNQVYALWSTTNLPAGWQVETELWPTNQDVMPFTVPTLDRPNLFLRAEDWTGVDSDGDGIPDWWIWLYFGNLAQTATNLDSAGNTLLYDYTNGLAPATFQFTALATPNNYFNTSQVPVQLAVSGAPYWIAILVDDPNFADANWTAYTSASVTVNLGLTEGWHQVWVGLRGRADAANAVVWQSKRLKLDLTPPQLVITSPTNNLVTQPVIQLLGYSPEALSSISYDLTNALGLVTNQPVLVLDQSYSTNTWEFTTNTFQAFDLPLTNGLNLITLHATDLAGNTTTTNLSFTLDYSSKTNPPLVNLYWPQDGTLVCNSNYTWRGWISDPTATVTAQLVDASGATNLFNGLVERDGKFWVENLPLLDGTNELTLTVADVVGNVATTNITVFPGTIALAITVPSPDQLWQQGITVNGAISDSTDYTVWVNGAPATLNGDGTWTATNVWLPAGGTAVIQAQAIPNSANAAGSGGGPVTYDNLGNPNVPQANQAEIETDKPSRLFVKSYVESDDLRYTLWYYDYATNNVFVKSGTKQFDYSEGLDWTDGQGDGGGQNMYDTETTLDPTYASTNTTQWQSQQTWPPSWWPNLSRGTQTASGDYDWPLFDPSIDAADVMEEQCVVTVPCANRWSGFPVPSIGAWENGQYRGTYTRNAQAKVTLQTGGKGQPQRENLWRLQATAMQYIPADAGGGVPAVEYLSVPIAPTNIQILGSPLGSDGNLWKALPDGKEVDVTPKVSGVDYFTFGVTTQKYTPTIMANGNDLSVTNPEFCVGQSVTFALGWDSQPGYTNASTSWVLPDTFVNEAVPSVSPAYYDENANLLTNLTTSCWYVDGSGGTAVILAVLHFSNGQNVPVAVMGNFTVYRPSIALWKPPYMGTPGIMLWSGNLGVGNAPAGSNIMTFVAYIQSKYPGLAGFTQLISGFFANDILTSINGYELDNTEWYRGQKSVKSTGSWSQNGVPFDDGPSLSLSLLSYTTGMDLDYETYLRFRPDAGDPNQNIFVTLGLATWSAAGLATNTGSVLFPNWQVDTNSYVDGPNPSGSNDFPIWTNVFHNQ